MSGNGCSRVKKDTVMDRIISKFILLGVRMVSISNSSYQNTAAPKEANHQQIIHVVPRAMNFPNQILMILVQFISTSATT